MQGNDSFRLVVRRGPQPNQTYDLNKDLITLGRDITNDIVINDPEVSRHHLRLTRGESGFTLEDLGSTNGTFVNGQRLTGMRPLNNGDLIGLGETVTLGYELVRAPGMAPSPIPPTQQQPRPQPPPQQAPPQQPQSYTPPPPSYEPEPQSPPAYAQQQPQQPQQGQQQPYTPPTYGPPPGYEAPPQGPPGAYDYYDPYAVREEEPRSATRWILIGCVGLLFVCCCGIIISLVIIDSANLWCKIPIFSDVVTPIVFRIGQALGFVASGGVVCP